MKVSEAIDKLKAGDTVWVKGMVDVVCQGWHPGIGIREVGWFNENTEISLTEPKNEKVEVPDFVAEWYETNKARIERAVSMQIQHGFTPLVEPRSKFDMWFFDESNHPIETLIRMKDGYTVEQPNRWVVRQGGTILYLQGFRNGLDGDIVKHWCSYDGCIKFTDKSKAEAVATLVEGSVEEV